MWLQKVDGASSGASQAAGLASRLQIRPEEFLTLLITELRYQDPLSPVDEREMLSQLAQLQELAEMQAMRRAVEAGGGGEAAAIRAVGRRVWWTAPDGQVREGTVERAVRREDGWWVEVGGELVPWWAVQAVGR